MEADELYDVLGLNKDASSDDIRAAYRALAKRHHPDLNPGDKVAEETFKKIQAANDILSDPEKRRLYDAGAIDAEGNETQRGFYREYAGTGDAHPYHSTAGFEDISDLFSDLFGARAQPGDTAEFRMRGGDIRYAMEIPFLEAINGSKKRVTMPDGRALDINVPAGLQNGQILRLRGQGNPGIGDAAPGDAYVKIDVTPHPEFDRRGNDIHLELAIALHEAVLGGKVHVPTVGGTVAMTVPASSNTGDTLRLKGKGVPAAAGRKAGDQIVTLKVVLPTQSDDALESFLAEWAKTNAYNPRGTKEG
ncbi:MAG: DnaJ domain-containing protein [Rhodospirillaceae bacterium]|nr:DnaJ domain-containing protein [Rhodospirillaceae bacterium]